MTAWRAAHKKVWPGRWTVPGGGLETDDYTTRPPTHTGVTHQWYDALEWSVRREVREETGLEITTPWLVCSLAFIRPDGVPVVVLSYAADLAGSGDVILDEDATDYRWVTLDEAVEVDLIDGIYDELRIAAKMHRDRTPTSIDPALIEQQKGRGDPRGHPRAGPARARPTVRRLQVRQLQVRAVLRAAAGDPLRPIPLGEVMHPALAA